MCLSTGTCQFYLVSCEYLSFMWYLDIFSLFFCFSDVLLDFCVFKMCVKYSCSGFMVYTKRKSVFINGMIPEENGVGGM